MGEINAEKYGGEIDDSGNKSAEKHADGTCIIICSCLNQTAKISAANGDEKVILSNQPQDGTKEKVESHGKSCGSKGLFFCHSLRSVGGASEKRERSKGGEQCYDRH